MLQKNTSEAISHLLMIFGLFMICSLFISFLALMPLMFVLGLENIQQITDFTFLQTHPYGRYILFYVQAATAIGGFFLTAWIYVRWVEGKGFAIISPVSKTSLPSYLIVILLTIALMPFTSLLVQWNAQMKLPAFLSELEMWAMNQEKTLGELTLFLTNFQNPLELFLGLVVMALLPALGEELIFRGLVQRNLMKMMNPHAAIWLAGIIFSAIHLQFYGFVPRMVLGVLFGYLYFWSGNLWTAILGHFINNGVTLLAVYFFNQKIITMNVESTEAMPLPLVFVSIILSGFLMYYFRKLNLKKTDLEGI